MEFPLNPGYALGPFELGSMLWNVLSILRSEQNVFPHVQLSWDSQRAATGFILLSLTSTPIHLLFDGLTQRLLVIEAYQPDHQASEHHFCPPPVGEWVSYRNHLISQAVGSNDPGVTLRVIHRLFGPTYPPAAHVAHEHELVVSYPGVTFSFANQLLARVILSVQPTGEHEEDQDCTPLAEAYFKPKMPKHLASMDGDVKCAKIHLGRTADQVPTTISFSFHASSPSRLIPDIVVTIGRSTSEDILCDFGAPLRTFWKEDDRMKIHAHLGSMGRSNGRTEEANPYFMSYFNLGIDFLIDPLSNLVLKVILHSNIPGEVLFARYSRCPWSISSDQENIGHGKKDGVVSSVDKAHPVIKHLKTVLSQIVAPDGSDLNSPTDPKPRSNLPSNSSPKAHQPKSTPRTNRPGDPSLVLANMVEPVMLLDRTADAIDDGLILQKPTQLHGLPGIVLEVTQDDDIETLWLF